MTQFVRGANPIWFFVNNVGTLFDDTYYAFFLTNDLPYLPQPVYQDPNGLVPWSNPIEFQANAGLPDNIFGDESLVYRIEFRQGPTQSDPLIDEVNNYIFGTGGGSTVSDILTVSENLITNPQFADISFVSPETITVAGTYSIAPGWSLVLGGTGTTTITQGTNAGDSVIEGNPAYYLTFNNNGWSTAQLIQRFSNNGAIFSGGAIAVAFSANATTASEVLTVSYAPSTGSATNIFSRTIPTGAMLPYSGAVNIPDSTSTDVGTAAYVNIIFNLPGTGILSLSNIQITGQSVPLSTSFDTSSDAPLYQELTYERMVDHEFNVYRNSIIMQPKDSILTGWNFGMNPWQFKVNTTTNVATNQYITDQTIVVQQAYVAGAVGNNVSSAQASPLYNQGLQIAAVTAHNQFAIIQYIDPYTIAPYWQSKVSSMVKAFILTTHGTSTVKLKMRVIFNASLPPTVSQTDPISSWTEGGDPVFNVGAGWVGLSPNNDPAYTLTGIAQDFAFDGFNLPQAGNLTATVGVVLYTVGLMNQTATADAVIFNDVSLVRNDFALSSNPKTWDQVLRECQFYYEKSYDQGVLPGTATAYLSMLGLSQPAVYNGANQWDVFAGNMSFQYKTIKRALPGVSILNPVTGANNNVRVEVYAAGVLGANAAVDIAFSTSWASTHVGNQGIINQGDNAAAIVQTSGGAHAATAYVFAICYFNHTADARLGA